MNAFKGGDDVAFVAFLDPEDRNSAEVFGKVAAKYRNEFRFGTATDKSLAESQGVSIPGVMCYRSVDGEALMSNFEPEKLESWVKESSRPVLGDLTAWNQQRLLDVRFSDSPLKSGG